MYSRYAWPPDTSHLSIAASERCTWHCIGHVLSASILDRRGCVRHTSSLLDDSALTHTLRIKNGKSIDDSYFPAGTILE